MADNAVHPVDEVLPPDRLTALGIQHVLVMYAGAVAVPFIIAGALGLPPETRTMLINADLFACGIATLVQAFGMPGVGIRLPVMMGVTFASVAPMLAMINAGKAANASPNDILLTIYGSVIAAGIFATIAAQFMSKLIRFFPPVVTGTIILVIGITLMRIGIGWVGGGLPTLTRVVEGQRGAFPNPNFGLLDNMLIATLVLAVIMLIAKYMKGFWANIAVLLGIVFGGIVAAALGKMNFGPVNNAPWFAFVVPFQFGIPKFEFWSALTMCIVMIVVMVESSGMFLALGDMTGKKITEDDMTKGLRADGVGTILGGIFNTFPYTSYSQKRGSCRRNRRQVALGGGDRRHHPVDPRPHPETGGCLRGNPGLCSGRRRPGHVRHGCGDRCADPLDRRLHHQPEQPVHRGAWRRIRHAHAGGAELLRALPQSAQTIA